MCPLCTVSESLSVPATPSSINELVRRCDGMEGVGRLVGWFRAGGLASGGVREHGRWEGGRYAWPAILLYTCWTSSALLSVRHCSS